MPHLVFLLIAQLAELQPYNLGADVGRQVNDLGRSREESLLLRVGPLAWLVVFAAAVANRCRELDVGRFLWKDVEARSASWKTKQRK